MNTISNSYEFDIVFIVSLRWDVEESYSPPAYTRGCGRREWTGLRCRGKDPTCHKKASQYIQIFCVATIIGNDNIKILLITEEFYLFT
jgi:hypothetical protein